MDNRSSNSRRSNSYSRSVVFPRIKTDTRQSDEREEDYIRHRTRTIDQNEDSTTKYVLDKLEFLERTMELEKQKRNALQEQVGLLTSNVQRLGKAVAGLQRMNQGENYGQQCPHDINFEVRGAATDMWNRLNNVDLNIIKLSSDLSKLSGDLSDSKRNVDNSKDKIDSISKDVDKFDIKYGKYISEFDNKMKVLKDDLDLKTRKLSKDIEEACKLNGKLGEGSNEFTDIKRELKMKQELEIHYLEELKSIEVRFDEFVEKHKSWESKLDKKLSSFNNELVNLKEEVTIHFDDISRRIEEIKINQKKSMVKSHSTLKDNYRKAFRAVYESITTMQAVLETKLKMTETDLKASINSILKSMSQ